MSQHVGLVGNERTQVLIIGMLDSIHFARWLEQFKEEKIDFLILPSKKFRRLHPILKVLIKSRVEASYLLYDLLLPPSLAGYEDYLRKVIPSRFGKSETRNKRLARLLQNQSFDFIHALEIQGAGYMVNALPKNLLKRSKFILTNWGSDIYFFKNESTHRVLIRQLLTKADFYSAECVRDYKLARELGFEGEDLPCIPNAGGFDIPSHDNFDLRPSLRNQIIIKGYGGIFGKADLALKVLLEISNNFPHINFFLYSVTSDIESQIKELPLAVQKKLRYSTQKNGISHDALLMEFRYSRVYIGCSLSDGISTSFLESLLTGAYPIQTSTSCAQEWIEKGAIGSIVELNTSDIYTAVYEALSDDQKVDLAAYRNLGVAKKFLGRPSIKVEALKFYGRSSN